MAAYNRNGLYCLYVDDKNDCSSRQKENSLLFCSQILLLWEVYLF